MNDGERRDPPPHGLVRTAAAQPGVTALEGSVFVAGAAVQWLRDGLGILADVGESERVGRARWTETTASTSCPPWPGWARPGGTPTRAG